MLFIGLRIRYPLHHDTEQLGDRIADGILADGDNQFAGVIAINYLLERRLPADRVRVFRVDDAQIANLFAVFMKSLLKSSTPSTKSGNDRSGSIGALCVETCEKNVR